MCEWEEQQEKDEVSLETKQRAMRGRVGVWTAGPTVAGSIRGKVAEIRRDHLHVALLPFHCGCRVSPPSPADDPSLRVRLLVRAQAKDKAPLELINNPIFHQQSISPSPNGAITMPPAPGRIQSLPSTSFFAVGHLLF